jgi:UDP-N-acetylglucosamine enolpyruvyl transferase
MIVIDNFLPKEYYNKLYSTIMSGDFDWNYSSATLTQPLFDNNIKESVQFNHSFLFDGVVSNHFDLIEPIYYALEERGLKPTNIYRTKVNMLMIEKDYPDNTYHGPHPDHPISNTLTMIYYLNDSDGDTFIFEEDYMENLDFENHLDELKIQHRITPKSNKAIIFSATQLQASSPPRETDRRVVINVVFKI